jgi:hypothetical protein
MPGMGRFEAASSDEMNTRQPSEQSEIEIAGSLLSLLASVHLPSVISVSSCSPD